MNRALHFLSEQAENKTIQEAAAGLAFRIERGRRLDHAMGDFPHIFSRFQHQMISSGLETGALGAVLQKLAQNEKRNREQGSRLLSALLYPTVIFTLCLLMVIVLPPLLFTNLFTMIRDQGQQIPYPTRVVMALSDVLSSFYSYIFLALLLAGVSVLCRKVWKEEKMRRLFFLFLSKLPVLGPLFDRLTALAAATILADSLNVGLPILRGMKLAGEVSSNPIFRERMASAREALSQGEPLSECLAGVGVFPSYLIDFVRAGEESGTVSYSLEAAMDMLEKDFDHGLEVFQNSIEPLALIVIGGIVGFFVLATLLPMVRLIEGI